MKRFQNHKFRFYFVSATDFGSDRVAVYHFISTFLVDEDWYASWNGWEKRPNSNHERVVYGVAMECPRSVTIEVAML